MALALLLMGAARAGAATSARDSVVVVTPTSAPTKAPAPAAASPAPAVTPAVRDTARRTLPVKPYFDQPRFVMFRSLAIPGWGQLHNHSYVKAGLVAGAESWLIVGVVHDHGSLEELKRNVDRLQSGSDAAAYTDAVNRYNARLDQLTSHQWFLGGLLAYALIDAYVDANFKGFDIEFRQDPALPGGPPVETTPARPGGGGTRGGGMRAALRWHF